MQAGNIPLTICDEVDKKIKGFIWCSTEEKRRMHMINWQKITKLKQEAGLGFWSM